MGRSSYTFYLNNNGPYFLTCTAIKWIALFGIPEIVQILLDSLQFMIDNKKIQLHGFVIMVNHIHLIASGKSLSKEIGIFKSYTARQIIDYLGYNSYSTILKQLKWFKKQHKKSQDYQVWEEGSHPQLIINREMLIQKLNYIYYNPVKCGYIDDPIYWKYSSYSHYAGVKCLLPITIID